MPRALIYFHGKTAKSGRLAAWQAALERRGWSVSACATEWDARARRVVLPRHVDPGAFERVFVAGGDGTLRAVVVALGARARELPLALLPAGNANVVAVEFGIPAGPAAVDVALDGAVHAIDALEFRRAAGAEPELALAMIGAGVDGTVTRVVDTLRGRWPTSLLYRVPVLGPGLLYVCGFVRALGAERAVLRLTRDGSPAPATYAHAWLSNTATYGTGWSITALPISARGKTALDGTLEWTGSRRTDRRAPFALYLAALRRRRCAGSDYGTGTRFVLESERPFRWQLDGDPQPDTQRLEVDLRAGAWRLWAKR